jgi:hypothetical protein
MNYSSGRITMQFKIAFSIQSNFQSDTALGLYYNDCLQI